MKINLREKIAFSTFSGQSKLVKCEKIRVFSLFSMNGNFKEVVERDRSY